MAIINRGAIRIPPSGRVTRRLRRILGENPWLGRAVYVELSRPASSLITVLIAWVVVWMVLLYILGQPKPVSWEAYVTISAVWIVMFGFLLWNFCSYKLVVCEGGLLSGEFFPFRHPIGIPWSQVDWNSLTPVRSFFPGFQRMVNPSLFEAGIRVLRPGQGMIWRDGGLVYRAFGLKTASYNCGTLASLTNQPLTRHAEPLWFPTRTDPSYLVKIVCEVAAAAGLSNAQDIPSKVLPSITLTGRKQDVPAQLGRVFPDGVTL